MKSWRLAQGAGRRVLDSQSGAFKRLNDLIIQSGVRFSSSLIDLAAIVALALAFCLCLLLSFATRFRSARVRTCWLSQPRVALFYLYLRLARARRIAAFGEQFPDALDVIVRGLRAGHPFRVALGLVAREMPDPVGSEFGIVADEIMFGLEQSRRGRQSVQARRARRSCCSSQPQ